MGEDADQIQRVVRRRDFAFAERLSFDETLDSFQQGEDADFIPYLHDFANATPDRQTDGFIKFTRFAVHLSPYGVWDDIGHATGFFPTAV
ncbi:hypothetical protein QMZ20_20085 [Serratia bockelmannii]|nr:hypothetical protein [Serratia bockelmannii]